MILPSDNGLGTALCAVAVVAYCTPLFWQKLGTAPNMEAPAGTLLRLAIVGWVCHGLLLLLGWAGGAPKFGFAPALSATTWLALLIYGVETHIYPQMPMRWAFCAAAAMAVVLAAFYPGRLLHPGETFLMPFHWALGIAAYGLFAVAVAHAGWMARAEGHVRLADGNTSPVPLLTLERLTFRFVEVGFLLLSATLIVAFLLDDPLARSSGRWGHKPVFSVLSWLTFAVLLLGRHHFGWRGKRAQRMLYLGAGLLLLAYIGSRFVLEVVLRRPG